jgi:hypothetical protein
MWNMIFQRINLLVILLNFWVLLKARQSYQNTTMLRNVSQPYFSKNVRMTLTLLKWGLGSPQDSPNFKVQLQGVKTPCIEVFFISLESYQSVDVENGLA